MICYISSYFIWSITSRRFYIKIKNFKFEEHFDTKSNNHISYEPIGVCGLITPWNWPINQIALKVIPAFATGCTMILKPSEIAPISAMFAEMIDEAGFPAGVLIWSMVMGGLEHKYLATLILIWFHLLVLHVGKLITKNAADTIKEFV